MHNFQTSQVCASVRPRLDGRIVRIACSQAVLTMSRKGAQQRLGLIKSIDPLESNSMYSIDKWIGGWIDKDMNT